MTKMKRERMALLFIAVAVMTVAGIVAGVSSLKSEPYRPLVLPVQNVVAVSDDAVTIEGALCNTDSVLVEAEVTLKFTPETRGRPGVPIFVNSVQDYLPGCEVHHTACGPDQQGDNGLCPISVCQSRIAHLPANVTACAPPFVNDITAEVHAEAEFSPLWRVTGTATPLSPQNGESVPIQSEVFEVSP
jgi:hypothetical protein